MKKMTTFTFAGIAILVLSFSLRPVTADKLKLKNGNEMSGIVTKDGENYVIEFATGKMKIHESEVIEVVKEETDLQKYRKKHSKIKNSNADAHYKIGIWAKTHGLYKQAQEEFRHTIQLDPGHEKARRELGYVKHNGQWMTRSEKMRRKGYVKYQGEWMTPEVKQSRIDRKIDLKKKNEKIEQLQNKLRSAQSTISRLENRISKLNQELQYERYRNRRIRYIPIYPRHPGHHSGNKHHGGKDHDKDSD